MDLEVKSETKHVGIHKQVFQLKTSRKDGMILQIHHTIPGVNDEIRRIRFVQMAFNDAGEQLAAADHRGNIFIIDLASSKFWLLANLGSCTAIAFSPYKNNEVLIGTTNGTVNILNTELGRITGSLVGHMMPATQMTFAQNRFCLSASSQEAIIWDLQSNSQAHRLSMRNDVLVKKVIFMPVCNHILACFQDDAMHIWNFETFEFIKQIIPEAWKSHHIRTIAFTRNGRAMVIGGHSPSIVVFALDNWTVKKVIELPEGMSGAIHLEFVPQLFDGGANKVLGVLSANCTINFLDTESFSFLPVTIEPGSSIRTFICSPNGKYIALILRSGEVNVYASSKLMEVEQCTETPEKIKPLLQESKSEVSEQQKTSQRRLKNATQQQLQQVHKQIQETLDLQRLRPILKEFGEYPESYRGLIWKTILQVPQNQAAFVGLVNRDCHPAYLRLDDLYPLENRSVLKNLKRLLSCLAHWSALFGEVKFLPLFVFPFVKVFQNDPFTCFEAVATIIVNWCQHWFQYFPFPPVNILAMIENVLGEHDAELLQIFYEAGVSSRVYAWPLLEVSFSEVLSSSEWLQLWDHILSNEPSFLIMAVVAYSITCRAALQSCKNFNDFEYFFHNQNPIDMKRFISKTYTLCKKTSEDIHPRQYLSAFTPLSKDVYPVYNQYPKFIVDYQAEQMEQIRNEEKNIERDHQLALELQKAQEKRIQEGARTEVQEARLLELEEAYRETIQKEEERVANHRQKIVRLRRELRAKELELLDAARDKVLRQHTQQRHVALDRLLDDVARKRARDDMELVTTKEELLGHYTGLLVQKEKLQEQVGLPHEAVSAPCMEHRILQQQQEKLKLELMQLREEANSQRHSRQMEITSRIAAVDDLLQRVEMELAREMAERQHHLMSSEGNIKVMQLETETKSLELEVEQLLDKLSEMRLLEGKSKLQEAVSSRADRRELNQEQQDLTRAFSNLRSNLTQQTHNGRKFDRTRDWIADYINKGQCSESKDVEEHNRLRGTSQTKNVDENRQWTLQSQPASSGLTDVNRYPSDQSSEESRIMSFKNTGYVGPPPSLASKVFSETSIRSAAYYQREQNAIRSAMNVREQILCDGASTARSSIKF